MPDTQTSERRRFLRRVGAVVGGFFGALFGIPAAATVIDPVLRSTAGGWVDAGPLRDVKEGVATRFFYEVPAGWELRKEIAYLLREGDEVVALSARCTHLGCRVRFQHQEDGAAEFRCPCHGGVFALTGEPMDGPVEEPLRRLETRVEKGQIRVRV